MGWKAKHIGADDLPAIVIMVQLVRLVIGEVVASKVIVQHSQLDMEGEGTTARHSTLHRKVELTRISMTNPSNRNTSTMELMMESQ